MLLKAFLWLFLSNIIYHVPFDNSSFPAHPSLLCSFLNAVLILSSWYICAVPHVWHLHLCHYKVMYPILSFGLNSFMILQLTTDVHKILLFLWFYKAHLAWTLQPVPRASQNSCVSVCLYQNRRYLSNDCSIYVTRFNAAGIQTEYVKESSRAAYCLVQGTLQVHKCV